MVSIRPVGDDALLVELPDTAAVIALAAALQDPPAGVGECVPAARTVLITFDPGAVSRRTVEAWIRAARPRTSSDAVAAEVTVHVRYDGGDLAAAAALAQRTPEAFIAEHQAASWTVAFTGFAPGFGYLTSADWPHRLPRHARPRTRVPAGSVALADDFCGVYPQATPGGWQLIGTTDAVLFDLGRQNPALLAPGTRVRFRRVR